MNVIFLPLLLFPSSRTWASLYSSTHIISSLCTKDEDRPMLPGGRTFSRSTVISLSWASLSHLHEPKQYQNTRHILPISLPALLLHSVGSPALRTPGQRGKCLNMIPLFPPSMSPAPLLPALLFHAVFVSFLPPGQNDCVCPPLLRHFSPLRRLGLTGGCRSLSGSLLLTSLRLFALFRTMHG